MSPRKIQGFIVIPLQFSSDSSSFHEIFLKEHSVRSFDEKKPPGRTLFAVNIPPCAKESYLKAVFSVTGNVESVFLQSSFGDQVDEIKSNNGFKAAFIVFEKAEGLKKCLKLDRLGPLSSSERLVLVGLPKWFHEYNAQICNQQELYEDVTSFLKSHDKEEEDEKAKEKGVDDDGWTVVTKSRRNPGLAHKESVENKIIQKSKVKDRKKELKNFYTFQLKEQKMSNIIALRKSFQESKEKVNLMKKMRNFKPY